VSPRPRAACVRSGTRGPRLTRVGRIAVRVQARSSRDEIAGEREGAVLVRVKAPPVDGRANVALRRLVAKRLGVAPSRVSVVRGASARDKVIEIQGLDDDEVRRKLVPP
jgi:uncharacterized protein